jgi:hypothetical protein
MTDVEATWLHSFLACQMYIQDEQGRLACDPEANKLQGALADTLTAGRRYLHWYLAKHPHARKPQDISSIDKAVGNCRNSDISAAMQRAIGRSKSAL